MDTIKSMSSAFLRILTFPIVERATGWLDPIWGIASLRGAGAAQFALLEPAARVVRPLRSPRQGHP